MPTADFYTRMLASSANIRSGPGMEHDVLDSISFFTRVRVHETQGGWYHVTYDDHEVDAGLWLSGRLTLGRRHRRP